MPSLGDGIVPHVGLVERIHHYHRSRSRAEFTCSTLRGSSDSGANLGGYAFSIQTLGILKSGLCCDPLVLSPNPLTAVNHNGYFSTLCDRLGDRFRFKPER